MKRNYIDEIRYRLPNYIEKQLIIIEKRKRKEPSVIRLPKSKNSSDGKGHIVVGKLYSNRKGYQFNDKNYGRTDSDKEALIQEVVRTIRYVYQTNYAWEEENRHIIERMKDNGWNYFSGKELYYQLPYSDVRIELSIQDNQAVCQYYYNKKLGNRVKSEKTDTVEWPLTEEQHQRILKKYQQLSIIVKEQLTMSVEVEHEYVKQMKKCVQQRVEDKGFTWSGVKA